MIKKILYTLLTINLVIIVFAHLDILNINDSIYSILKALVIVFLCAIFLILMIKKSKELKKVE